MPEIPLQTRVEIIAEIANAHQGSPQTARQLAAAAARAGADAVKFQIYSAEELLVEAHPRYQHFKGQAFSQQDWKEILADARELGVRVYCDVFGDWSLDIATSLDVDGIKIHSSDLENTLLLRRVAGWGKRTYLAVGGSTLRETARALKELQVGPQKSICLLYGFQRYPTLVSDAHLDHLKTLSKNFGANCTIGYMDHTDGDDPFAVSLPLLALASGARVIEKHITLDRAAKGVDYFSSLNPEEFSTFVQSVRTAEEALKHDNGTMSEPEQAYRRDARKSWVAVRALPQDHTLQESDVVMKRVAPQQSEIATPLLEMLVGHRLRHAIAREAIIRRSDVEQNVYGLIIVRMASARLPGKALLRVGEVPALQHLLERVKQMKHITRAIVCTTELPADDVIADIATATGFPVYRGPVDDVLARMLGAIEGHAADAVVRITGDDILLDPSYADKAIAYHLANNMEYSDLKQIPSGTEVEVFDAQLLRDLARAAKESGGTEYLTTYVTDHKAEIRTASVPVEAHHARTWRLTLDTPEDYEVISRFLDHMLSVGKPFSYTMDDIVDYFTSRPDELNRNASVRQRQAPLNVCTHMEWNQLL